MRRVVVACALAALAASASAQTSGTYDFNYRFTVPDPPAADSSNRIPNTRWVLQNAGGGGGGGGGALNQNWIFVGNASNVATGVAMSGDCGIVAAGIITCTKTNGTNFAAIATSGSASDLILGAVAVNRGGTGASTLTNHGVLVGTGNVSPLTAILMGQGTVLQGGGAASDPIATASPTLGVGGSVLGTLTLAGSISGSTTIQPLPAAGGTLSFPAANDQLVGRATTDTLTNKTINGANNTLSVLASQVTGILTSSQGGTGNQFFAVTGPAGTIKTFTFPNADATVLTTNAAVTIAQGGTGQTTALGATGSTGLNVNAYRGVGDASATIAATDRTIGTTAAFSASRTWTLPAANAVNAGQTIRVADYFGGVTGPNSLVIARAGADTINGATSVTINTARGGYTLTSDGVSAWSAVPQGATAVAGVSSIGGLTGAVNVGDDLAVSGAAIVSSGRGFVNKFRNPGMDVAQRGTNGFTTAGTATYTLDGWAVTSPGAAVGWAQGNASGGSFSGTHSNSILGITGQPSVTGLTIRQRIEGSVAAPLAGRTVTVQAKWLNGTGGSVTPTLTVRHANALDNWSASTTDVAAQAMPACGNGLSCTMTHTFTAVALTVNGLEVTWDFGNNFTGGKVMQFTDADIRVGGFAAVPEIRPIGYEMPMNQRYYYRRQCRANTDWLGIAQAYNTTSAFGLMIPLPQPLRAQANPTVSSGTHFSARIASAGGATPFATVGFSPVAVNSTQMITADMTGSASLVSGNATVTECNTAAGFIEVSAEL